PSRDTVEQKFKNLGVTASFVEVATPSIEAVTADEVAVLQRVSGVIHAVADLFGQGGNILRVGENLDPGGRLMRGNAFEAFEHLIAGQLEAALRIKIVGEHRAPDGMRV